MVTSNHRQNVGYILARSCFRRAILMNFMNFMNFMKNGHECGPVGLLGESS